MLSGSDAPDKGRLNPSQIWRQLSATVIFLTVVFGYWDNRMGRLSKDEGHRLGPKLWPRFLLWHFNCHDLGVLNAQLPLPIEAGEKFVFGEIPKPILRRTAPKLLEQAYYLGRNPDGRYTPEFHDETVRFNLYERVVQRVPESRHWLLKDLAPFLAGDCPHIDSSADASARLLAELGVVFVREQSLQSWAEVDPAGLERAEMASFDALTVSTQPECLALLFVLSHQATWQQPETQVSEHLAKACWDGAQTFAHSFEIRGFEDGWSLGLRLMSRLESAKESIRKRGHRSLPTRPEWELLRVPSRLVVLPNTPTYNAAMDCLHAGSDWSWELLSPLAGAAIHPDPTGDELLSAAIVLGDGAAEFNRMMMSRAVRSAHQGSNDSSANPSPDKVTSRPTQ